MCQVVIPIGNPPRKGVCEKCGRATQAWDARWVVLCPTHWLEYFVR